MKKYTILYEDSDLFVIRKPAGVPVQSARASVLDIQSMLLRELRERGVERPYLGLVNRLDQPVEGIFVAAKNEKAAAALSRQAAGHVQMEKDYRALVCGMPGREEGVLVDWLLKDGRSNTSRVVPPGTKGAKRSELHYRVAGAQDEKSLLEIRLLTGRHHQIRVQLAHAGMPVMGDSKYGQDGKKQGQLCLCAYRTVFLHPRTGESMSFETEPTFSL